MRVSVFLALSLDGFLARPDGSLDWLPGGEGTEDGDPVEDHGYADFVAGVDAHVLGRGSYDKVLEFGVWPYEKPTFVLTSRPLDRPAPVPDTVEPLAGPPEEILAALAARGIGHVHLDGGDAVRRFLRVGLVDRLVITRIPVLIGRGIPLFGDLPDDVRLEHVGTRAFPGGLVQSDYRRPAPSS
jgi:dihydrofolate reductase